MSLRLRFLLLAPVLTLAACSLSMNVDPGRDGGAGVDAGADAGRDGGASIDAGHDGSATVDAGSDGSTVVDAGSDGSTVVDAGSDGGASVDGGVDAGCFPTPCAAPPPGCHYEGGTQCSCGTLVCTCPGPGPGLPCCVVDTDCGKAQHCVGEICSPGGSFAGVCEADLVSGQCWEDADCANGKHCVGASVCPCGASCLLPDRPGTCATQPDCRTAGCDAGLDCCGNTGLCYNPACLSCCM